LRGEKHLITGPCNVELRIWRGFRQPDAQIRKKKEHRESTASVPQVHDAHTASAFMISSQADGIKWFVPPFIQV
jgi:hypothetical protein